MSKAIFIASVVELPMMFLFNKINKVIKTNTLMKISVSMFFVKHLLTFLASNIAIIYVAQCVQIFAYALFIPASVYYVRDNIQSEDQLKGQALITMAMTLAGIFADLCGGDSPRCVICKNGIVDSKFNFFNWLKYCFCK